MTDANRTVVVFIAVLVLLAISATAAAVSVTRELPDAAVSPGQEFVVTLTQSGFFLNTGFVNETLPEGFTFVWGSLTGNASVKEYDETTNNLTIDFECETTVTYNVTAGTAEQIEDAVFYGTWATVDSEMNKIYGDVGGNTTLTLAIPVFDTGPGTYPSISGTHNGTIKPNQPITVQKLYTYPCSGTGGHTEYARIENRTWNATATWNGYTGDWHNISFDYSFVLVANETYNYTIRTGSYPQIHHTDERESEGEMGIFNCTSFVDANGKVYNNWIPAIGLWS